MTISEGTLQSLRVLRDISAQGVASKEKEKDRSLSMAQLRIQADERRLERMSSRLAKLQEERRGAEAEFTKLTGTQVSIQELQKETGTTNTDTLGFLEGKRMNAIDKRELIGEKIGDVEGSLKSLNERLAGYYEGFNVLAGKPYEKYRAAGPDKTIRGKSYATGEELESIMGAIEDKQGRPVSAEQRAGVLRKLEESGKLTFEQLLGQETLYQRERILEAKKKGDIDKAAQGKFVDNWKQLVQNVKGTASRLDIPTEFAATLPDVLTTVKDITQLSGKYLDEIGRIASRGLDRGYISGDTSAPLADLIEEYDNLMGADKREQARDVAASIARYMQEEGSVQELDFSTFWGSSKVEQSYLRELLAGMPVIEDYSDYLTGDIGMGEELFYNRSKRAARRILEEGKEGTKSGKKGKKELKPTKPKFMDYDLPNILGEEKKEIKKTLRLLTDKQIKKLYGR